MKEHYGRPFGDNAHYERIAQNILWITDEENHSELVVDMENNDRVLGTKCEKISENIYLVLNEENDDKFVLNADGILGTVCEKISENILLFKDDENHSVLVVDKNNNVLGTECEKISENIFVVLNEENDDSFIMDKDGTILFLGYACDFDSLKKKAKEDVARVSKIGWNVKVILKEEFPLYLLQNHHIQQSILQEQNKKYKRRIKLFNSRREYKKVEDLKKNNVTEVELLKFWFSKIDKAETNAETIKMAKYVFDRTPRYLENIEGRRSALSEKRQSKQEKVK